MSNSPEPDLGTPGDVDRRAADFLQRRRFWTWGAADQAELDLWLAQATAHRVAFLRLQAADEHFERLVAPRPLKLDRSRGGRSTFGRLGRSAAIAAIAASLVLAYVYGLPFVTDLLRPADRSFATDVGGRAQLRFGDGTEIELNTDSLVRYRMTSAERIVWLEKGEAWFDVAHDASRRFIVYAGGARITDLGTEFLVRDDAARLQVALLRGKAELQENGSRPGPSATLTPGDSATSVHGTITLAKLTPQQIEDATAWRKGALVFHNTKLSEAVREFNRYTPVKLVIADPSIANLRIGGRFRTNNLHDFLSLAEAVLKIRFEQRAGAILLFSNNNTKAAPKMRAQ